MGNHHEPADVDPKALENAHTMWVNFTQLTKYSIAAIIVILAGMAIFLT